MLGEPLKFIHLAFEPSPFPAFFIIIMFHFYLSQPLSILFIYFQPLYSFSHFSLSFSSNLSASPPFSIYTFICSTIAYAFKFEV